jgi:large subunit ribosomal protein L12
MSEYVHAALLLHMAKKTINEENLKSVMKAAGIEADEARVKILVSSLASVNIDDVLSSKQQAVAQSSVSPVTTPTSGKTGEAKSEAKEEKKEEFAGLGALFE